MYSEYKRSVIMNKDKYENISKLLSTLFYTSQLDHLVNCANDILANPMQVYDSNYFCLAHTDMSDITDPIWILGEVGSNCLYEFASILNKIGTVYKQTPSEIGLVYYDIKNFGEHRRRIIPLTYDNELIAFFIVLEYYHKFEDIDETYYKIVAGALTKEVASERKQINYNLRKTQERILLDLMNGNISNRDFLSLRLAGAEFAQCTSFYVISADMSEISSDKFNFIKPALKEIFHRAWPVLVNNTIVLLVDCSSTGQLPEEGIEKLKTLTSVLTLHAGISDKFNDLFNSSIYYRQSLLAAELSKTLKQKETVSFFNDYKLWLCADSIDNEMHKMYISNTVKSMHEYDLNNGCEYVKTFYHYLGSNRSLIKTSQIMHLHRNTVVYRLERMKALFGINTDNGYENMQNYFGCMLIVLNDLKQN